jgi:hypothetical protein
MRWSVIVRAWGGAPGRFYNTIAMFTAALLAAGVAGCSSSAFLGQSGLVSPAALGSTVAFESIDGPPPEVFNRLVASLNDEAGARKIIMVSRSAPATYRIRGYVSAAIERGKTSFAWVWDVYDADKQRVLRITGEEPGGPRSRRDAKSVAGAWTAADAQVLQRMARSGMEQIASFLAEPGRPPAAAPQPGVMTLVSKRDDSPEAAGILRVSGVPRATPDPSATADAVAPPAPAQPAKTRSASAAVATDGRGPYP